MKTCSCCKTDKPFSEFFKGRINKDGSQGYTSKCKECTKTYQLGLYHKLPIEKKRERQQKSYDKLGKDYFKQYRLTNKYNIDLDTFNEMYTLQKGKCYICEKDITGKEVKVDHNHTTGKVRKLLCHNCNTSLGLLNEDKNLLMKCVDYLKEHDNF